ncbi:MAG: prepilin-type N-terminal cleavage/methylation domain-containing protein [Verrucomicrobium sp.]|nr:prepilin-type N-terminal cleavage/methylation domain-containing protein [Verrucomicrobium sp.]
MRRTRGFSLIEVVLSLALLSFSLIALLALCSVGLGNGRKANDDTVVASILWQEVGAARQRGAAAFRPGAAYFDVAGQPTNGSAAYYECALRAQDSDSGPARVRVEVSWPASVPAPQRPHRSAVTATLPPP